MPPHPQAPARQRVLTSPTPAIADIVFYERHDSRLATNASGASRREYGSPHPAKSQFPNHKLAFIEPDDQKGWEKWWYVADRDSQDDYNFETSYPYDGLKDFPRYKRTYVVARAEYEPLDKGVADPKHPDAKLIFEEQVRTGERQLDNLYVVVVREYDYVPDIQQQNLHNLETTYPYAGIKEFPRYTRTYIMPRQDYEPLAKGAADPTFEDAKLIREEQRQLSDPKLRSLYLQVIRTYDEVATVEQQATFNAQISHLYAGRKDFRRITRRFVLERDSYVELDPGTADSVYAQAKLISENSSPFNDPELDSQYVLVTRVYDEVPSEAQQDEYNAELTRPYAALSTFIRVTREYVVERDSYSPTAVGTADTEHTNAKLIDEQVLQFDNELQSIYVRVRKVFDYLPDAATQETYNAEETYPYRGLKEFPRYTRRYVYLRSEYEALAHGTADPVHSAAVLVSQQMSRFREPSLDSRYVIATRVYDIIPDLANTEHADVLEGLGYRVLRPHGDDDAPQLIWTFPIKRSDFVRTPEYSVCPIAGYGPAATDPRLLLTDEKMEDDSQSPVMVQVTRTYSLLPGPTLQSVVKDSPADVPGKFVVERTTTVAKQDRKNDATADAVGGDVTAVGGAKLRSSAGPAGRSTIVHAKENTTVEVEVASLTSYELDPETGVLLPVTQELVAAGTDTGSAIDADGNYSEIQPYNAHWDIKTTRKSTGLVDERSYQTFIHYTWPAVLQGLNFYGVLKGEGADQYIERYGYDTVIRAAYHGPCLATITEGWSATAPAGFSNGPTIMQPREIVWNFILSRGSISPTLHAGFTLYETTGTTDPRYPYQVMQKTFQSTNFIDWPAQITAGFNVTPWRGGYRWKRTVIKAPYT